MERERDTKRKKKERNKHREKQRPNTANMIQEFRSKVQLQLQRERESPVVIPPPESELVSETIACVSSCGRVQGDPLSATLFSATMSILVAEAVDPILQVRPFNHVDDTALSGDIDALPSCRRNHAPCRDAPERGQVVFEWAAPPRSLRRSALGNGFC